MLRAMAARKSAASRRISLVEIHAAWPLECESGDQSSEARRQSRWRCSSLAAICAPLRARLGN
eukprot:3567820-Alexandrium_andersonii.AAC.1